MAKSQRPGQVAMLEADPDTLAERALPAPHEYHQEPTAESVADGPSVSLVDYYEGQLAVLGIFNKINKGENFRARFEAAAGGSYEDEAVIKAQLLPRYGSMAKLNQAYDRSVAARERLEELAKSRFAHSMGYDSVLSARLRPGIVVGSMLDRDYDEFSSPYYGIANKAAKEARTKELKGRLRELKKRASDPEKFKAAEEKPADIDEPTLWSVYLDENGGMLGDVSLPDPEEEMSLTRFARVRGSVFGDNGVEEGVDVELQVRPQDFANIEPAVLRNGLFIHKSDPRYKPQHKNDPNPTEQLAWALGEPPFSPINPAIVEGLRLDESGVVLPADEFSIVAHSPVAMTKFAGARTRNHNADNTDINDADEKVGRSRGHIMENKLEKIGELIPRIDDELQMFRTIYRAADPESGVKLKAKDMDVLLQTAEERLHVLVGTARLNLGIGPEETQAMHRALTSRLYRGNSDEDLARNWRVYASLGAQYAYARLAKATQSRNRCQVQLDYYQPFLDRAQAKKET